MFIYLPEASRVRSPHTHSYFLREVKPKVNPSARVHVF